MSYNGWSTYETWRVFLELGGYLAAGPFPVTPEAAREAVLDLIDETSSGFVNGIAHKFVSEVDWEEIANALNEGDEG